MIRVDAAWLADKPMDMRAGTDTAVARVIKVFGSAHPHHAYLFGHQVALTHEQLQALVVGLPGSLRAGQRAAAVMSSTQSAKLNGVDPHAYLKDVLQRLPTHKALNVGELLPHRWKFGTGALA